MKIRRFILAGLWLASLAAISFLGNPVSYRFFWAVTLIGPLSFVYLLTVVLRFKLYQQLESRSCVSGQPVPYFFVLQNEDRFAFVGIRVKMFSSFSYVEDMPEGIEYQLLPGDRFVWHTNLVCKYRGEYEVGVKEIVATDFFGLFSLRYKNPGAIKALVSPRCVRLHSSKTLDSLADYLLRESPAHDAVPAPDVREYMPGDDIRLLHWRASAKAQKLIVRNRTGEEKHGLAIFLDTRRFSQKQQEFLPVENKMLEVLLAVGGFLAGRGIGFSTHCLQSEMTEFCVRSPQDFEPFYQFCSHITFGKERAPQKALSQFESRLQGTGCSIFLFILHQPENEFFALTERLIRAGFGIVVYLVTDQKADFPNLSANERRRIVTVPTQAPLEGLL